jgi:hypothetical protein
MLVDPPRAALILSHLSEGARPPITEKSLQLLHFCALLQINDIRPFSCLHRWVKEADQGFCLNNAGLNFSDALSIP